MMHRLCLFDVSESVHAAHLQALTPLLPYRERSIRRWHHLKHPPLYLHQDGTSEKRKHGIMNVWTRAGGQRGINVEANQWSFCNTPAKWCECCGGFGKILIFLHNCVSSPQVQVQVHIQTQAMDSSWCWMFICADVCLCIQSNCTASTHHPGTWDPFQYLYKYATPEWTRREKLVCCDSPKNCLIL